MIINYFRVPFISAFSIDDYIESLTLGIAPSGEYIEGRVASDSFTGYLTGFNRFFSGSGYWLTSGSTYDMSIFLNDAFSGYASGTYQSASLNGGFIYQQYATSSGATTGNLYLLDKYTNDSFSNYATGGFTGSALTGNVFYNSYNVNTGATTGNLYPIAISYPNSGSITNSWTITQQANISSTDSPFAGTRNYISQLEAFAYTLSSSEFQLGDYTVEMWVNRTRSNDLTSDVIAENSSSFDGFRFLLAETTPETIYYYNNGVFVDNSGYAVPSGTWFHLAAVRETGVVGPANTGELRLYFSGQLVNQSNTAGAVLSRTGLLTSTQPVTLGASCVLSSQTDTITSGRFAEFRLWNYARSQTEIQSSMNNKINPAAQTGLLLYLSL